MDKAIVCSDRGELFRGEFVAIFETAAVGLTECDVAGGIFVKERIREEQIALRNG